MKFLLLIIAALLAAIAYGVYAPPSPPPLVVAATPPLTPRKIVAANAPKWDHFGKPINRDPVETAGSAPAVPATRAEAEKQVSLRYLKFRLDLLQDDVAKSEARMKYDSQIVYYKSRAVAIDGSTAGSEWANLKKKVISERAEITDLQSQLKVAGQ